MGANWTVAIIAAAVTAFASLGVGWLLERYRRQQDAKPLAAAILAEVTAIERLFIDLKIEEKQRAFRASLNGPDVPTSFTGVSADALTFPITVYEKCADRIGVSGSEAAADVVRFYDFLKGFRVMIRVSQGPGALPAASRAAVLDLFLNELANEKRNIIGLKGALRTIADEPPKGVLNSSRYRCM